MLAQSVFSIVQPQSADWLDGWAVAKPLDWLGWLGCWFSGWVIGQLSEGPGWWKIFFRAFYMLYSAL
jgi:hypothetical protein